MKPPVNKPLTTKSSCSANATAIANTTDNEIEPGKDLLKASTFTKALDPLKSNIFSKIEVAVSRIQAYRQMLPLSEETQLLL